MDLSNKISPIICGGLGNNLFQIATSLSYAKDIGCDTIFGYWTSFNSKHRLPEDHISDWAGLPNPYFGKKWGGWKTKDDSVAINTIFPKLNWFENPDPTIDGPFNTTNEEFHWSFEIDTGTGGIYEPFNFGPNTQFYGYFFNKRYWHHNRQHILDSLEFNQGDIDYINKTYDHYLCLEPVSINIRVQDPTIASEQEFHERAAYINQADFIEKAVEVFGKKRLYIVTTNNIQKTKAIFNDNDKFNGYDFVYIDEDFHRQMMITSLCKDHILTNSTFSFWAVYLNKNLETAKVVYSKTFEEQHSTEMVPYNNWIKLWV